MPLVASTADVVLTTLGGRPFTVGWMAGRALSVAAASVLLVTMVGEISQMYRNLAGVHERLMFQAAHDVLTGALARRALIDRIELLVAAANHEGVGSVLAIVDLDHLKQINDRHGHIVGDRVLAEVAQRMRLGLRDGDDLGRYGGDEFVLVMPGPSLEHGWAVASRVLELIRSVPVDTGAGQLWVTATMGMAGVAAGATSVDEVLTRADAALYQAKSRGRDRVFAEHLNGGGHVSPSPRRTPSMTTGNGATFGPPRERGRHRERGQAHAMFQARMTVPRDAPSRHTR